MAYAAEIHNMDLDPLDLSDLGLLRLPACLFTDPIFADANISGNKCSQFPKELTVGSVRNIKLYEQMGKQITKNQLFGCSDILGQIVSFSDPSQIGDIALVNKDFNQANRFGILERLKDYKKNHYKELPEELQKKLDRAISLPIDRLLLKDIVVLDKNIDSFLEKRLDQLHNLVACMYSMMIDGYDSDDELPSRTEFDQKVESCRKIINTMPKDIQKSFFENEVIICLLSDMLERKIAPEESENELYNMLFFMKVMQQDYDETYSAYKARILDILTPQKKNQLRKVSDAVPLERRDAVLEDPNYKKALRSVMEMALPQNTSTQEIIDMKYNFLSDIE